MATPCESIARQMGALFECSPVDEYTRIRTPFLYPDGDVIDLFVSQSSKGAVLTDLGETLRWLRAQSLGQRRSPKQRQLIEDICLNHGVELFRGMLTARLRSDSDWAASTTRLAQAAIRVADLWFTLRTRAVESVTDEVADYLVEKAYPFTRAEVLAGRSGKSWTVDFHVRLPARSSLVCVLSTGSRGAARGIVDHALATWYDLSHLKLGQEALRFVSLFDDTLDVWNPEDFRLLADLSDVGHWSRPDEIAALLAAA